MEHLKQRKKGVLPTIEIAGHTYTVDIRLNELRNRDEPWRKLMLDEMVSSPDGRQYLFFYDIGKKSILQASPDLLHVPEHAVLVEMPNELGLDPVGSARKFELGDEYFLDDYPYVHELSATLTSLEKSGLPEFVANNRMQNQNINQGIKQKKI